MLVMFCGVMAYENIFKPVEIPQDNKYIQERAALETKADRLATEAAHKTDSIATLLDSISVLTTTTPQQIHQDYETTRQNNWALPADSARDLYRARLDTEDEYRKKFIYGTELLGRTEK